MDTNIIFKCITGSCLYGFNNEESDRDMVGVYIPTINDLLGIKTVKEAISYREPNDLSIYSIVKFATLASKCNPNVIEILYVPDKHVLFEHEIWNMLKENRNLFLSRHISVTFGGYARSRLSKIKRHNDWYGESDMSKPNKEYFVNVIRIKI